MNKNLLRLKDVSDLQGGFAFKSKDFNMDGIPLLRIGEISEENIKFNEKTVYVSNKYLESHKKYCLKKNDILIALSGATTGKFARYDSENKALLNQRVLRIRAKEMVESRYLFYCMNLLRKQIIYKASGVAQPNISPSDIGEMKIPLPSILNQKKIVEVLDKAQELIDLRKRQIKLLDELIQSVFYDMFGDPVTNSNGWKVNKLGEVGSLQRGKSKHRPRNAPELLGGKYPLVQTGDIANAGFYLKKYKQTYSESGLKQSKMWSKGTLCITIAANIAKTSILGFDACFPDSVVAFIPTLEVHNMYVQLWFGSLQRIIEANAPESAQKNINLKILNALEIPVPPIDLQNQFAQKVKKIEQQKQLMQQSLNEMENNFNSLMQKAFKGELFN